MILYVCNEISDYWDTHNNILVHLITKEISRNRFQELHIRVQLAEKEAKGFYAKISYTFSFLLAYFTC
jgi:hypothetical protein